jgi:predicted  nucleic acid-binding Zn-ribbon protein
MREDVQILLQVQEIDHELMELEVRRGELPLRRSALLEEERALRAEADAVRERLRSLLMEGRQRESEMRAQEDRAARYQGQLAAVSTNKEYVSLLTEIKGVKEKVSAAEDRALAILEETEQLRARAEALDQDIRRSREASLASRVGRPLLRKYESILRRGRLPALVPIRGRACGNCFGTLPLQAASEIRRQEQPYACEHCGVILYIAEGEVGAA